MLYTFSSLDSSEMIFIWDAGIVPGWNRATWTTSNSDILWTDLCCRGSISTWASTFQVARNNKTSSYTTQYELSMFGFNSSTPTFFKQTHVLLQKIKRQVVEPCFATFFLAKLLGKHNFYYDLQSLDPVTWGWGGVGVGNCWCPENDGTKWKLEIEMLGPNVGTKWDQMKMLGKCWKLKLKWCFQR